MSTEPNPPFLVLTLHEGKERVVVFVREIELILSPDAKEPLGKNGEPYGCSIKLKSHAANQIMIVSEPFQQVLDTLYRLHAPVDPLAMMTKMMQQLGGEDPNGVH